MCYAIIGIPLFLLTLANISSILGDFFKFIYGNIICFPCNYMYKLHKGRGKKRRLDEEYDEDDDDDDENKDYTFRKKEKELNAEKAQVIDDQEDEEEEEEREINVPLCIVLGIVGSYMYLGGLIFSNNEGWTMIQSVYFVYVSLTTMGN